MKHLDIFGNIDYRRPIGHQQDMRTAYHIGHRYYGSDPESTKQIPVELDDSSFFKEDPALIKDRITENQAEYVWKVDTRNPIDMCPTMRCSKTLYLKAFEDQKLKFLERPIRPATSVTHDTYTWRPNPNKEVRLPFKMPTAVVATPVVIETAKPGYSKYLDPSATTSRLAYVYRTPEEVMNSIAANDNITFWNWNKIQTKIKRVWRERDAQLCDNAPSKDCTKRRKELPSTVKHVPHGGLTSETRASYSIPHEQKIPFELSEIRNSLPSGVMDICENKTESNIYGSGECVDRYV